MIGQRIAQGAAALGIRLPGEAASRFDRYHALLQEWNRRMDLTNVGLEEEAIPRHYLDSLTLLAQPAWLRDGMTVVDVGTGAGFPGLPLAIARPDWRVTLVDALAKRVAFCRAVVEELGLSARVEHSRAEDFARAERGRYDLAVSRAVASLPVLLELTLPLLAPGGLMAAYKGPGVLEEWENGAGAARMLGGELLEAVPAPVPGTDWNHLLVMARQRKACPAQYPRKAGTPERKPLGSPKA